MRISDGSSDVCSSDLDARNRDRKFEAEIRILAEFGVVEAAVERGVQKRARRLDRHALDAVHRRHAAGPAGVDEPALDAALGDALLQKIAIDRRMARHEGGTETGREGRLGLGHADLGPRDARSEEHTSELQSLMRISYAV